MKTPLLSIVASGLFARSNSRSGKFLKNGCNRGVTWLLVCLLGVVLSGSGGKAWAAISSAAADAAFTPVAAWPTVAEWVFDHSSEAAGAVEVTPVREGEPLVLLPGMSLVADNRAPGGKALKMDGTQSKWATSANVLPTKENVYVDLRFCASQDGAERQTLVKLSRGPEIRVNLKTSTVELILWTVDKKWISARVPYVPGEWSALRASVIDGVLTLELNGEIATARMPEGGVLETGPSRVYVGCYGDRPFKGAVAYLALRSP